MHKVRNWAGNLEYRAAHIHSPSSLEELQALVAARSKVRVLGSRHSFNDIADTEADLISLENFTEVSPVADGKTVTVGGGVTYGKLCEELDRQGFAVHNLASLPHISVVGACATATHGSGEKNGNLATAVGGLEFVTADGEVVSLSRSQDGERFSGAVVNLGALGAVTKVTLDVEPAFLVSQRVYEDLPFEAALQHFDEIQSSGYSVSLFTDWKGPFVNQVWVKERGEGHALPSLFGANPAPENRHPIPGVSAENCTEQMGVPGLWSQRLAHFKLEFTPSSGEELQSEYYVPRRQVKEALRTIDEIKERIAPLLHISEIRTIAADSLWMSPCYREDCVAIHFTWHKNWPAVRNVLPLIEERLEPFEARPHWGKLFLMDASHLRRHFPCFDDFKKLAQEFDPAGKFRNDYLERCLFSAQP